MSLLVPSVVYGAEQAGVLHLISINLLPGSERLHILHMRASSPCRRRGFARDDPGRPGRLAAFRTFDSSRAGLRLESIRRTTLGRAEAGFRQNRGDLVPEMAAPKSRMQEYPRWHIRTASRRR